MKDNEIDISVPEKEFTLHLKENERIIFSGPFGIGKSTFIEEFFKKHKSKYFNVRLTPIDYSISTNEDIFELVKYDILINLIISDEIVFDDFGEFTKLEFIAYFIADKFNPFSLLVNHLARLGNEDFNKVAKIVLATQKLAMKWEKLSKTQKNANQNVDANSVSTYLIENEKNNFILENGFIKSMINKSLKKIKDLDEKVERKTVLIIDDLDRIDPEHIFRMFNVFASRLGFDKNDPNKLFFDHVIFVCDIENIRSIFHHKYGLKADFEGYIDKFYSTEIFSFDNSQAIKYWLDNALNKQNVLGLERIELEFVYDSLTAFLGHDIVSLRKLIKAAGIQKYSMNQFKNVRNGSYSFMVVYVILKSIMGSHEPLVHKVEKLRGVLKQSDGVGIDRIYSKREEYFYNIILPLFDTRTNCSFDNTSSGFIYYEVKDGRDRKVAVRDVNTSPSFILKNEYFIEHFLAALELAKNKL